MTTHLILTTHLSAYSNSPSSSFQSPRADFDFLIFSNPVFFCMILEALCQGYQWPPRALFFLPSPL